ncbi:MAG: hypothetical protein A2Y21_02200 [Clostridiales bacterium GWC2_40_7]|nr:MAG: hypothetical protein A2Y21_02200 [Clostridiales bacterium GWC2_40_7]
MQKLYNEKYTRGRVDCKGGLSARSVRYIHIIIHESLEQALKNQLFDKKNYDLRDDEPDEPILKNRALTKRRGMERGI